MENIIFCAVPVGDKHIFLKTEQIGVEYTNCFGFDAGSH